MIYEHSTLIASTWVILAAAVAYAARRRGRLVIDWFVLALAISPPLAAIILFLRKPYLPYGLAKVPNSSNAALPISDPFLPDSTYLGVPYRLLSGGAVDALMLGGVARFRSLEHLKAAIKDRFPKNDGK